MPASSRAVYGREFRVTPVWLWIAQRASAVLLGPLVLAHVWAPKLAGNAVLNVLILAIVLVHGYSGVRRLVTLKGKAALFTLLAIVWCVVVAVFGVMIVASPSPLT